MTRLNAKTVEMARPREGEYRLPDGSGLYLRVRSSGAKSWLFLFRLTSSRKLLRMTLGSLEEISLKEARASISELRKLVSVGIDPRNARAAARIENTQAITMQRLFDAWLEFEKAAKKTNPTWIKRHENRWRNHLKKPLGILLARDVSRAHLAAALDSMTRKGIKEETRKGLTTLNLMLDYALTRHFIDQNPARMLKPKDFSATANRPRERVLTLKELRQLWLALDGVPMALITVIAIKLLILTGARRSEVAGMRWSELDFESKIWLLPSNRTKNRQAHSVYLSDFAINLLKTLWPLTDRSLFVFDTGRNTKGHIQPDSLNRAMDRMRKSDKGGLKEFKPFTIHDLRRSAATAWGEYLKTEPHIIERMLNHLPLNKLVATYQRAIYSEEQKEAWVNWGKMVENQIANWRVCPI